VPQSVWEREESGYLKPYAPRSSAAANKTWPRNPSPVAAQQIGRLEIEEAWHLGGAVRDEFGPCGG